MDINWMFGLSAVWAAVGAFGLVFSIGELIECQRDLRLVRKDTHYLEGGNEEIVTIRDRRNTFIVLVALLLFTFVGGLAVLTPSSGKPITPLGLFFRLLAIGVELLMTIGAKLNQRDRRRLLRNNRERRRDLTGWGRHDDNRTERPD